jgi:P pilus assembly chaperone PapD
MRRFLLLAAILYAAPAMADADNTLFDVAPTTLDLKTGEAGLFYITNHGSKPVAIQVEALDWQQADGADKLSLSQTLFTSPPLARIPAGARQTVRVLARGAADGSEAAYRLRVSQLPDDTMRGIGIQVLMQFIVPVFVNHKDAAPQLTWSARDMDGKHLLTARNLGRQAIKLDDLTLNGATMPEKLIYILPGASHDFAAVAGPAHIAGHDARTGHPIRADLP